MLRSIRYRRIKKYDLNFCEDRILDMIDLTVNITDMVLLKNPGILQEIKKLNDGVLLYGYDFDIGYVYSSLFE